jgi:hypothetical protein
MDKAARHDMHIKIETDHTTPIASSRDDIKMAVTVDVSCKRRKACLG